MVVWFLVIGACGISGIAYTRKSSRLSPSYAVGFLTGHFSMAFFSLAAVVLAITGAEALYADMGHLCRQTKSALATSSSACGLG
jgi:KUP system potassium uptake protein